MFYAHFVLNKKGPLARIWLAAHWDKKLTRAHVFETNINSSVEAILEPKVKLALRTSGHLLLGVVRIYSRKTKYLLADCNEAFVKIKMAFRPGMVDLPEEANREAAIAAITLPENIQDFEATIADLNELDVITTANQSRPEDITMREDLGEINLGRQDDDFGEEASTFEEPREGLREADAASELGLEGPEGPSMTSIRASRTRSVMGGDVSSVASPGPARVKSGGPGGDDEGVRGGVPSVQRGDVDMESDDDLGGGFMDTGGGDSDDGFGGEIDHVLFAADTELFGDTNTRRQLEHFTSEFESQIGGALGAAGATPARQEPGDTGGSGGVGAVAALMTTTATVVSEQTTLLPSEAEAFALPPIDASSVAGTEVRSRATKRKRRLVIDEQKSIPSEVMKVQMSDTSDITAQLDLAPPTKKLMHWKETGGVDQLFAMPGRVIPSPALLRLFTRNLRSVALPLEAEEELVAPPTPRGEVHDILAGDTEISAIAEAAEPMGSLDEIRDQLRTDPFLQPAPVAGHDTQPTGGVGDTLPHETPYIESDSLFMAPPSVLSEAPPSVLQTDMMPLDRDFDDEDDGDMLPSDTVDEEAFEERRLEKRSKVMLRVLQSTMQKDAKEEVVFQSVVSGSTKKQAAAKFYTILLLRKQRGIDVQQGEPFSDILVSRGPNFTQLSAAA